MLYLVEIKHPQSTKNKAHTRYLRYLVDGLKVAMEFLRGPNDLVEHNEFRKIFALMMGDEGTDL